MNVEDLIEELERYPSDFEVFFHERGTKVIKRIQGTMTHKVDKYSSRKRMMIFSIPKEEKNESEESKRSSEENARASADSSAGNNVTGSP